MKEKFNTKNALVAYMDILGYSEIVKKNSTRKYYHAINNALVKWYENFAANITGKYPLAKKISENLFFEVFSDSFIVFYFRITIAASVINISTISIVVFCIRKKKTIKLQIFTNLCSYKF